VVVAGAGPLALRRGQVVAARLAATGAGPVTLAGLAAGGDAVIMTIERTVHIAPACLGEGIRDIPGGALLPPPGCANAANLEAMVADPADLLRGRRPGPADGAAAALAIERYRQGLVTPLQTTPATP
jgi:hypothetical protein